MSVPSACSRSVRALTLVAVLASISLGYHALAERAVAWIATTDAGRAWTLASVGLEASLRAVAAGKDDTLGSPQDPVFFERGSLYVEARCAGPRELRLVATADVGLSRARAELVVERGSLPEHGSSFQAFRLR